MMRHPLRSSFRGDAKESIEDFLAISKSAHHTVAHHGNFVGHRQNAHSVRDDHNCNLPALHALYSVEQQPLSLIVETGIRIIEHHERRVARLRAPVPIAGVAPAEARRHLRRYRFRIPAAIA